MSDATKAMWDFLTKSPSVVFPDEVMELFVPIEKENETLRMDFELYRELYHMAYNPSHYMQVKAENERLRELVVRIWNVARLMDANKRIEGMRITDDFREECERAFKELGIEVEK